MRLAELFAMLKAERAERESRGGTPSARPLVEMIADLRPRRPEDVPSVLTTLNTLTLHLHHHHADAALLRDYLLDLLYSCRHRHLFTETGILSQRGFFTSLAQRFAHKILPAEREADSLKDLLGGVFWHPRDYEWLCAIPDVVWGELLECLRLDEVQAHPLHGQLVREQLEAIRVLSYRIAALGLDPEMMRIDPTLERHESPFVAQNIEMLSTLTAFQNVPDGGLPHDDIPDQHLLVLLDQCVEVLDRVRRVAREAGASILLTYQLVRGRQMIDRMCALLAMVNPVRANIRRTVALDLFRELVREENRKTSLRDVMVRTTDLLALKVTDHASRTGEHYAASSRAEYLAMARSAAGAGVLVGFMALIKIGFAKLALAPFWQALAYSLNYSFGFMLVHVLHFTIATKQPAMTAAAIAATVEEQSARKRAPLDGVVDLIAMVLRTQIVAILGNVMLAIPVSFLIAYAFVHWQGAPPADAEKAAHLIQDINPFASLALFHAAIAGVCLFLAGLVSGYYDNKSNYNRIPQRVRQLHWLKIVLGEARRDRLAHYVGANLGALAGNFWFGIMLGSMGTLGWILGLPIDIRHVTFSAANLAYGLVGLNFQVSLMTILISVLGVFLIGLTNLAVSFSLALYVALKSRQVRFDRSGELIGLLWQRFRTQPGDFLLPPKLPALGQAPAAQTEAASDKA